jgi:DivIVA domain-containing protein
VSDTGPAGVNDLIGWLGNATAQLPRRRQGYRVGDVDAFLDQIVKALRRGAQPDPGQVRLVRFGTTRRRPGYDRQSVAALLDEPQHRLRGLTAPGQRPGARPDSRAAGLMEQLRSTKFRVTRLGPGYDEEDVDDFLDEVVATLGRGEPLTPAEVRGVQFRTTRVLPGYAQQDVDDLLAQIERYASGYDL